MNILKISRLSMLWFCLLAIACAEDKGNYTYEDKAVITIDSISSMLSVLANAEYIDLKPVVTSNLLTKGKIRKVNGKKLPIRKTFIC
mgnify:CR=1 FL=1